MSESSAWLKGYRDFWANRRKNPYRKGSINHQEWLTGWNEGKEDFDFSLNLDVDKLVPEDRVA